MGLPNYTKSSLNIGRGLKPFNLTEPLFDEINEKLKNGQKLKLFEIGCGQGILLLELLKMYPVGLELHGVNLDKNHGVNSKNDFKKNAAEAKIEIKDSSQLPEIHFANATSMPFTNGEFDIVISQVTFIHIQNKAKAIEEVYRVLKNGGLALISLGGYSINRKRGHEIQNFYRNLNRRLGKDYNPRFLIKSENKYSKFSHFVEEISKYNNIKLFIHEFTSKVQRARGCWLIIRKEKSDELKLPLKYDEKTSQELTEKYSKNNPVNFGCIDVYDHT